VLDCSSVESVMALFRCATPRSKAFLRNHPLVSDLGESHHPTNRCAGNPPASIAHAFNREVKQLEKAKDSILNAVTREFYELVIALDATYALNSLLL
jgi:hypothetical protein